jgi:hypothetical protein
MGCQLLFGRQLPKGRSESRHETSEQWARALALLDEGYEKSSGGFILGAFPCVEGVSSVPGVKSGHVKPPAWGYAHQSTLSSMHGSYLNHKPSPLQRAQGAILPQKQHNLPGSEPHEAYSPGRSAGLIASTLVTPLDLWHAPDHLSSQLERSTT